MKRLPFTLVFLFAAFMVCGQNNVGINDDNSTPKASAMLDVCSSTKGLLIPRIALTSSTTAAPVTSPETSLLIYNTATAGDVTPGYYYWNGSSKWVRLIAGTDPDKNFNAVTKAESGTLLKTENMVFASGDISLTLPEITSADNGLEITIKNVGTFTDQVKIFPHETYKIDGIDSSYLTRWLGRTFVAMGSNWIVKGKEARTDNFLEVSSTSSFTTIAEAVAYLDEHMTGPTVVRLGGGELNISSTISIDLSYPVTFQGLSYGESIITSSVTGSPLFTCSTECYFKMIDFEGSSTTGGSDAIHLTGSEEYYEIKDCNFFQFNKGIVANSNTQSWIFETDFEQCTVAGIEVAAGTAANGLSNISETDFTNCGKGISLLSGSAWTTSIGNCNFYCTAGQTGIYYNPTNFTNFTSMIIANNGWNNTGTFLVGFDFARTDGRDANAFIDNNHGMESKRPHFSINVLNNSTTTSLTGSNVWIKCLWTNTSAYTSSWLIDNNKYTYLPQNERDVIMWISGSLSTSNSSKTVGVAVTKNGVLTTRYGETRVRTSTSGQPYTFGTVVYLDDVSPGDYFELVVTETSYSSGDKITMQDVNWFSNSQ